MEEEEAAWYLDVAGEAEPPPPVASGSGSLEGEGQEGRGGKEKGGGDRGSGEAPHCRYDLHLLSRQWPAYEYKPLPAVGLDTCFAKASFLLRRYLGQPLGPEEPSGVFWVLDIAVLLSHAPLLEGLFGLEMLPQHRLGIPLVRPTSSHLILMTKALGDCHRPMGELPTFHTSLSALQEEAASCHPHLMLGLLSMGIQVSYNTATRQVELVADPSVMDDRSRLYTGLWALMQDEGGGGGGHTGVLPDVGLMVTVAALCSLGSIPLGVESQVLKALIRRGGGRPLDPPAPRELQTLARLLRGRVRLEDFQALLSSRFPSLPAVVEHSCHQAEEEDVVIWVACRHPPSRCPPETSRHALRSSRSVLVELSYFRQALKRQSRRGTTWEVDLTTLDGDAVERALHFLRDRLLLEDVVLGASGPQSIGPLMEVAHVWGAKGLMDICCELVEERVKSMTSSLPPSCPSSSPSSSEVARTGRRDVALAILQLFDLLTVAGVDSGNGRDTCLRFIIENYQHVCKACEPDSPSLPLPLPMRSKRKGRGSLDHFSASPMALAIINNYRLEGGLLPEPERVPDKCPSLHRILEEDLFSLSSCPIPGVEILPLQTLTSDCSTTSSGNLSRRLLPAPFVARLHGPALESTPWAGLQLLAKFRVSTAYPRESPRVSFIIVPILHPNIEPKKGLIFPETLDHIDGREGAPCLPSLRVVLEYLVGPSGLLANPTLAPDRVVDPVATELVFAGEGWGQWTRDARRVAEEGRRETMAALQQRVEVLESKGQLLGLEKQSFLTLLQDSASASDLYRASKMVDQIELRWDMEEIDVEPTHDDEYQGGHRQHHDGKRRKTASRIGPALTQPVAAPRRRPPAGPDKEAPRPSGRSR